MDRPDVEDREFERQVQKALSEVLFEIDHQLQTNGEGEPNQLESWYKVLYL